MATYRGNSTGTPTLNQAIMMATCHGHLLVPRQVQPHPPVDAKSSTGWPGLGAQCLFLSFGLGAGPGAGGRFAVFHGGGGEAPIRYITSSGTLSGRCAKESTG